jgi:thiol-disulfide isomerase/thioredoxin
MDIACRMLSLATVLAFTLLSSAAASAADKPADKPAAQAAKPAEPAKPAKPAAKPDPFVVPDGTADELVAYLDKLGELRPEKEDPATVEAFRKRLMQTAVTVADKLLAAKPDDRQAELAVQLKAQSLFSLRSMGQADAGKRLEAFPGELVKMGRPKLGRLVSYVLLANRIRRLVRADAAELRSVIEDLKKYLGQNPEREDLQLVLATVEMAEAIDRSVALQCYADFGKLLEASPREELKRMGVKLQGTARRLGLIGKKMPVEGTTLAGKPFQIDSLQGKVVLVVFWATWCGPCRAEIPEIRAAYADYHGRGFEVISISLDREREDLDAFLKDEKLPWPVLFDSDPQKRGFEHPMAVRYGVMAIPAMVLLDRQGKGVALDPRGPNLAAELAKLLGPASTILKPVHADAGVSVPLPLPALGKPK